MCVFVYCVHVSVCVWHLCTVYMYMYACVCTCVSLCFVRHRMTTIDNGYNYHVRINELPR